MSQERHIQYWSHDIKHIDDYWERFKAGKDTNSMGGSLLNVMILRMQKLQRWYKENPQGDDRPHKYLSHPKISLDIDEVLAGWVQAWVARHGIDKEVHCWSFDRLMFNRFEEMKEDKEFWLSIDPLIQPKDFPFEPHAYITARSVPQEWTEEWLFDKIGYPYAPVYTVPFGASKVAVARASGTEIHVDDSFKNFVEMNKGGICTYLWDAPHNQKYDVGYKRISNLKDLVR